MNIVWFLLIVCSVLFAIINNRLDEFTKSIFTGTEDAVRVSISLVGIMALWLGITKIIEASGLVGKIASLFRRVLSLFFKNIPKEHPAMASISLNIVANFFGLGNAATPLGIKAMNDLQTLNEKKDTVTFEMMLFLVVNTSSIQLIPFSVIGLLANFGSQNPSIVVLPTIIATVVSSASAVLILYIFKRFYRD